MNIFSSTLKISVTLALASLSIAESAKAQTECGMAAYYDTGSVTANGEAFDPNELAAAHPWIPMGSWVTVVDQDNGREVSVRINDRGPWSGGFIVDLTPAAINAIDPHQTSDVRNVCLYWSGS
jgi:rare lipoprotein A